MTEKEFINADGFLFLIKTNEILKQLRQGRNNFVRMVKNIF